MSTRKRSRTMQDARPIKKARVQRLRGRYAARGSELKFFDTALSFNFDSTGEVPATGQLCLIPQGVTESTRVGRKCVVRAIQIKGTAVFEPGAAADLSAEVVHLFVVQDKQTNGAAAAVTQLFTGTALGQAMRNMANSERFVILKHFVMRLQSGSGATTSFGQDIAPIDWYSRCNIPLEFDAATGAITELRTNNVYLVAGCVNGDDQVAFTGTARIYFSDGS